MMIRIKLEMIKVLVNEANDDEEGVDLYMYLCVCSDIEFNYIQPIFKKIEHPLR